MHDEELAMEKRMRSEPEQLHQLSRHLDHHGKE